MKHTIIPVLFFMLASIPTAAFAQGMELALNTTSVDEMVFTSKDIDSGPSLTTCDEHRMNFTASAARKLFRTLNVDRDERVKKHELGDQLEVEDRAEFAVTSGNEGRSAALVAPNRRYTFAVVVTAKGPVVASIKWRGCHADTSHLVVPQIKETQLEPFRDWGLRMKWHLPSSRPETRGLSVVSAVGRALSRVSRY